MGDNRDSYFRWVSISFVPWFLTREPRPYPLHIETRHLLCIKHVILNWPLTYKTLYTLWRLVINFKMFEVTALPTVSVTETNGLRNRHRYTVKHIMAKSERKSLYNGNKQINTLASQVVASNVPWISTLYCQLTYVIECLHLVNGDMGAYIVFRCVLEQMWLLSLTCQLASYIWYLSTYFEGLSHKSL